MRKLPRLTVREAGRKTLDDIVRSFVGHGVGLELDEWPPLQKGTDATLQQGMVLAVEPKLIYLRRGAIGIEDTYLLTADGLSRLTISPREISVV